jgi:beta-carotene hydroxylase
MTIEAPSKTEAAFARLEIPEKFHRISPFATVVYLAHALAFFLGPAIVAFAIVDLPMISLWD